MKVKARESMEEERGELVQAVKDHAVVPHDKDGHQAPHAQHIVSLVITVVLTQCYPLYLPYTTQDCQERDLSG